MEAILRVDLDAKVRTRDGEDAGTVERAVVDPRTNEVTNLVVSTGTFIGRDVLVPRQEIDRATVEGDAIRLQLTKRELEELPDYVPAQYGPPPAGWVPPAGYGLAPAGYLWPIGYGYAEGYGAAIPGEAEVARGEGRPEISIAKGSVVFDRDGDDIGVVDDVIFDQSSGKLRGFVLRIGGALRTLFGGGDTVEVGGGVVDRVSQGAVYLRVAKDEIK